MIVIDTNIISYLYLPTKYTELAEQLLQQQPQWVAPMLWISEFRNVLTQYLRNNLLEFDDTVSILQEAESLLSDQEYKVSSLSVMNLVSTSDCSAYDCEFVALAENLNTKLVTQDKKIIRNFPQIAFSLESYLDQQP